MSYQPERGDAIEAWIKRKRDEFRALAGEYVSGAYWGLDGALDEYRLHADTGAPLEAPSEDLGGS